MTCRTYKKNIFILDIVLEYTIFLVLYFFFLKIDKYMIYIKIKNKTIRLMKVYHY